MSATRLLEQHDDLCKSAKDLMTRKNHDYTSGSGDPFANFRGASYLGIKPELGILLRMQDKMMRIRTFIEKGELKVKDESVKDALVDLVNYTVLIYGLIQEGKLAPATADKSLVDIDAAMRGGTMRAGAILVGEGMPLLSGASAKEWLSNEQQAAGRSIETTGLAGGR